MAADARKIAKWVVVSPRGRALGAAGIIFIAAGMDMTHAQNGPAPQDGLFSSRKDTPDGSTSGTIGRRLPTEWDAQLGVDVGTAAPASASVDPQRLLHAPENDTGKGAAWANATLPGLPSPLGWDKTAVEARVDSAEERGKLATTLSRSLPLTDGLSMTLQNSYAVSRTLAPGPPSTGMPNVPEPVPSPAAESWETSRGVRVNILPTSTAVSAGTKFSSTDDKWLRTFSAEQKIYGPLNVTGSVSETPTGPANKSLTAGFKTRW